jgi:hypothetical protein
MNADQLYQKWVKTTQLAKVKLWQRRSYGIVEVELICACSGCNRLGGVEVVYTGIPSIAKVEDLFESREDAERAS